MVWNDESYVSVSNSIILIVHELATLSRSITHSLYLPVKQQQQ